jgi:EpsI family protein
MGNLRHLNRIVDPDSPDRHRDQPGLGRSDWVSNLSSFDFLNNRRFQIVTAIFLLHAVALFSFSRDEVTPTVPPLRLISDEIGTWVLAQEGVAEKEALGILQPDDYLIRDYTQPRSGRLANLFIAYFKTQRGERMPHSPKNCLPGNGWVSSGLGSLSVTPEGQNSPIQVNNYVVSKGDQRALVLYWYQTWKRTIANEYAARMFLALDSIRDNRTDTALVRIMIPIPDGSSPADYQTTGVDFLRSVYPQLAPYFPKL